MSKELPLCNSINEIIKGTETVVSQRLQSKANGLLITEHS